mgnify:CR=1 FL=1
MKADLRNQIESHCNKCSHLDTSLCNGCFFASVDIGTPELGGREQYTRAFNYLRVANVKGFKRDRPFGNYLQIERKEVIV